MLGGVQAKQMGAGVLKVLFIEIFMNNSITTYYVLFMVENSENVI